MMALYRSLLAQATQEDHRRGFDILKYRAKMEATWAREFVVMMEWPITPPHFREVVSEYGEYFMQEPDGSLAKAIKPVSNVRLATRRCLIAMESTTDTGYLVSAIAYGLKSASVLEEAIAWYPAAEKATTRIGALTLCEKGPDSLRQTEHYKALCRRLAKTAKTDWCPEVVKAANEYEEALAEKQGGKDGP